MLNWSIVYTDEYDRRRKRYTKKNSEELKAVVNNFDTYLEALERNVIPQKITAGFIHREGLGVKAIDQKGSKGKLKQTRLYIYPDITTRKLYLLTIGDKRSQKEDIKFCHGYVRNLRGGQNG
jgi:hypothetical protein